jgi:TPR repeat protein
MTMRFEVFLKQALFTLQPSFLLRSSTSIVTFCLLLNSSQVIAGYNDGLHAFTQKDYQTAMDQWSAPELNSNPDALFALGVMYFRGIGIDQNQAKGTDYYLRSAELGFSSAQFNLGLAFYSGSGVSQDRDKSQYWWLQAAGQDHPVAQYNLAAILWSGNGVNQDQARAMHWFRKSRENGNRDAANFLLTLYAPMYRELNADSLQLAANNTRRTISLIDQLGMYKLGLQAMEKRQYAQAFGYWEPLAMDGYEDSQYQIARLYEYGEGVEKDFANALNWYQRAAQKGQGGAQYRIGLYHINESPDKNEALGLYWMQSAADNDSVEAAMYINNL